MKRTLYTAAAIALCGAVLMPAESMAQASGRQSWAPGYGQLVPAHYVPAHYVPAHYGDVVHAPPPWPAYAREPYTRGGNVFVPGHWEFRGHVRVWVPGMWVARHSYYDAPTWIERDGRWYAQRGRWSRGLGDSDHDGIPNRYDRDRDNDGVPNRWDRDRDGDGVPNRFDRRPDNPRWR
jgi:hypothetical protein